MAIQLLASGAKTASGVGAAVTVPRFNELRGAVFLLDVTAGASGSGDKLDVFVQSVISGAIVDDVIRFTQVLGNAPTKQFLAYWSKEVVATSPLHAPQDGAMSAGVNQGAAPGVFQVKYVVTDSGAHVQTFTFSVSMVPIK